MCLSRLNLFGVFLQILVLWTLSLISGGWSIKLNCISKPTKFI